MATQPEKAEAEFLEQQQFDANDPQQVNEARKKAGRNKKKALAVVDALMQHGDGREWVYQLLYACDVFRLSYMAGESHPDMCFREGKKYIGLQLLADVRKANPDNFHKMMQEAEEKKLTSLFPENGLG